MILDSNILFSPTQIKNDFSRNRKLYMEFAPDHQLKSYIFCYWVSPVDLSNDNIKLQDLSNELIVPDGCIDILLISALTINEMIAVANKYFATLLNNSLQNNILNNTLLLIYKSKGNITVKDISKREVISERQMRRIFNNWIGINPKTFCKIVRFQNTLKTTMVTQEINWTNLALESGYYDQTHFINEFKEFCSSTPEKLFSNK